MQEIQGMSRRWLRARMRGLPSAQNDEFQKEARDIQCGMLLCLVCLGKERCCLRQQCTKGGRRKHGESLCTPHSWSISCWRECRYLYKCGQYYLVPDYWNQQSPEYVISCWKLKRSRNGPCCAALWFQWIYAYLAEYIDPASPGSATTCHSEYLPTHSSLLMHNFRGLEFRRLWEARQETQRYHTHHSRLH